MGMFFKQKSAQMGKLLWSGIIAYTTVQISTPILMITKYGGMPQMGIQSRSHQSIIGMEPFQNLNTI